MAQCQWIGTFTNLRFDVSRDGIPVPVQLPSNENDIRIRNGKLITESDGLSPIVGYLNEQSKVLVGFSSNAICSRRNLCPNFGHYHVLMEAAAETADRSNYKYARLSYIVPVGNDDKIGNINLKFEKVYKLEGARTFILQMTQLKTI